MRIHQILSIIIFLVMASVCSAGSVWIEGEKPSKASTQKGQGWDAQGWGNRNVMSKGELLHVNMNPKQAEATVPAGGLIFSYEFNINDTEKHNIWARIGYEWVRSNFDWRIDGGQWQTVSNEQPTTNIQPIQTWNEIAWLKLAAQQLKAGKHSIEFRHTLQKKKDRKGNLKTSRILHMLDVVYITTDDFLPQGKWQPGVDHRAKKDRDAEKQAFAVPTQAAAGEVRPRVELTGLWQYASWDETEIPIKESTRTKGVTSLPKMDRFRWYGIKIPSSRESELPEQVFAHRYLLRTKFNVPASFKGKGFFLDIQRSSLITSVFVNGTFLGYTDTFHTAWQMDLSPAVKAGQVNELVLCIKDAYYSLNPKNAGDRAERIGNRNFWGIPRDFLRANMGTASKHDYPIAADTSSGIQEPAAIVVAGNVYTDDVFCKPSVKSKKLALEVTLRNPTKQSASVTIENQIIPWNQGKGGAAAVTFSKKSVTIPAGETLTTELSKAWANPRLWWPDNPYLYWVETKLTKNGRVIDVKRTRFGFREWDWSTHMFVLNGVKWPMWADTNYSSGPKAFVEQSRTKSHQNQVRYWRHGGWGSMTRRQCMDYFDETGMLVRSSGTFDGQLANYGGGLREPDTSKPKVRGRHPLKAKSTIWNNWRKQMTAWIKEERNHPSIYIWSVENEIAYINVHNLGQYRECEPELTKGVKHVMKVDPTRPAMVDGGNCLRDESLPVNGAHYTELMNVGFRDFPDAAYTRDHFYDKNRPQRGAWRMVPNRPIMKGEIYFANGYSCEKFATIGGDRCFIGMGQTMAARGVFGKILSEGYRWAEVASFHFWLGSSRRDYWISWSPVAVLCRQWNWTWGAGAKIDRTLKVFNSTSDAGPIEVSWEFKVDGKRIAGATKTYNVPCGEAEQFDVNFSVPNVSKKTAASLILTAKRNSRVVFNDTKPVTLLAPASIPAPNARVAVYDPKGSVKAYLTRRGIAFKSMKSYGKVPKGAEVVIVGSDAIPMDRSTDSVWLSLASKGMKIIVLDQEYPLSYRAVPADLRPTKYTGRFGFSEDLSHPIFAGLTQADFFTWGNDHVMYRNAYKKGTYGGRSLLQCDDKLAYTALFESKPNDGLLILSQLAIGSKIKNEAVAQQVFMNLLNYAAAYKPIRKESYVALPAGDKRLATLKSVKLKYGSAGSALQALQGDGVAIVDATPANLKALAANKSKVDAFCKRGGWLMLWGLTPEGLADYNRVVGYEHALRPFNRERVLLSYPMDAIASGLTLRDVVMDTGKKMFNWMALMEPDTTAFSWLVDHTDIAPFCKFPSPLELGKGTPNPVNDHKPRNMVNGFTSDDNWTFTYTIIMDQGHERKFSLELPKEEELVAFKIRPSKLYHPITKVKIYFDDDPTPVVATIPVKQEPGVEDIPVPGRKAKKITIEIAEWAERGNANIVVIDNIWLQVKRSERYMKNVSSVLNIGALMAYRNGKGGIFLNQLNILGKEVNPDNINKKATIVKTVLANMGAVFEGAKLDVDHVTYEYKPIKIQDNAFNAYVHSEKSPQWFRRGDIQAIPVGNRTYGGVDFFLSDFSTSPVPSVLMLQGGGSTVGRAKIQPINVNRKADALFFLHTFNPDRGIDRWMRDVENARRRKKALPQPPHVMSYVVHYQDGQKAEVKVQYGKHIGAWNNKSPLPLSNADLGWVGKQKSGAPCSVWTMKWVNPRPEVTITKVLPVTKNRGAGAGALFAVSTGEKK